MQSPGVPAVTGFGALETGLQYQLFIDVTHELMALAGISATWGHTGRVQALGEHDFTTLMQLSTGAKASATCQTRCPISGPSITGNLSVDFPTKVNSNGNLNSSNLNYCFAIEDSLEYLQHHVREVGDRAA